MPLYKFYRIVPNDTTHTDCYIGHTTQSLLKRYSQHCREKRCSSKDLIKQYGKDNLSIILIHELELPDKDYARREERRLIEVMRRNAINKQNPWSGTEEQEEELLREIRFAEKKKLRSELIAKKK